MGEAKAIRVAAIYDEDEGGRVGESDSEEVQSDGGLFNQVIFGQNNQNQDHSDNALKEIQDQI